MATPSQEDYFEIGTVEVHGSGASRLTSFILLCAVWAASWYSGNYIGLQQMSVGYAFIAGFAIFLGFFLMFYLYSLSFRKILFTVISVDFSREEVEKYLRAEDHIIDMRVLNMVGGWGMTLLGVSLANEYRRARRERRNSNKTREGHAIVFLVLCFILIHWWFLVMTPRFIAQNAFYFAKGRPIRSVWEAFKGTWPWLLMSVLLTAFAAAYFGAEAIQL